MSDTRSGRKIMLQECVLPGRKQVEVNGRDKCEFVMPGKSYIVKGRQVPLTLMRYFVLINKAMSVCSC